MHLFVCLISSENGAGRAGSAACTSFLIGFGLFDFNEFHVFLRERLVLRVHVRFLRLLHKRGDIACIVLLAFLFFFVHEDDSLFDFLEGVRSWRCSGILVFIGFHRSTRRWFFLRVDLSLRLLALLHFVVLILIVVLELDILDFVYLYLECTIVLWRRLLWWLRSGGSRGCSCCFCLCCCGVGIDLWCGSHFFRSRTTLTNVSLNAFSLCLMLWLVQLTLIVLLLMRLVFRSSPFLTRFNWLFLGFIWYSCLDRGLLDFLFLLSRRRYSKWNCLWRLLFLLDDDFLLLFDDDRFTLNNDNRRSRFLFEFLSVSLLLLFARVDIHRRPKRNYMGWNEIRSEKEWF